MAKRNQPKSGTLAGNKMVPPPSGGGMKHRQKGQGNLSSKSTGQKPSRGK